MSSDQPRTTTTGQKAPPSSIRTRHGVFIRTDPVLKVYIEHTLAQERNGEAQQNHLHKSNDISLDDDHIFLTNQSTQIDAEMIDEGLKLLVDQWMKTNSFAQNDEDDSDDE